MSELERKFLDFVGTVCRRPVWFRSDFYTLVMFLEGYIEGSSLYAKTGRHPFGNLLTLLENAHGFSHPAWGWWRHYLHDKVSFEKAVKDFPDFLNNALETPETYITELDRKRETLFGRKPPISPQTAMYDAEI